MAYEYNCLADAQTSLILGPRKTKYPVTSTHLPAFTKNYIKSTYVSCSGGHFILNGMIYIHT